MPRLPLHLVREEKGKNGSELEPSNFVMNEFSWNEGLLLDDGFDASSLCTRQTEVKACQRKITCAFLPY
jgi:hypothetical protein